METPDRIVEINGISKKYKELLALDRVSFHIQGGEIFGYIGPNGAGKTTTFKILVGLLSDFSGSLSIDGLSLPQKRHEANRLIGYMPQNVSFQEWRTVEHVLATFGRLSGLESREIDDRMDSVLELVGLSRERGKKVVYLSGGMTQKLGLAQALLHDPRLLVLDEPFAGLDPESRHHLKTVIKDLGDRGKTVLFSSHILSDVQDMVTRIGILNRGRLLKTGTLDELISHFALTNQVEIVLSRDSGEWKQQLSMEGKLDIEEAPGSRLLLKPEAGADHDEVVNAFMQALLSSGCRIKSVTPVQPSLDEVYLKYIRESNAE